MKNLFNISRETLRTYKRDKLEQHARAVLEYKSRFLQNPISFFRPMDYQKSFWSSRKKEKWVFGGNRSGKTKNGASYLVDKLVKNSGIYMWACTWADLSIPVQQRQIYNLLPLSEMAYCKYSEQNGFANRVIVTKKNSILRFKTYDQKWESFQGTAKHLIWNDEEPPEDIYKEQKIRLIDYNGEMVNTMTPLNGMSWVYSNIVSNPDLSKDIDTFYWETRLNKMINQEAFKKIIATYGEKEALVRSKGAFINLRTGRIYYAFIRQLHERPLKVNPDLPLRLSFDFNVNPMTTTLAQITLGNPAKNEQTKVLNILEALNSEDCNARTQCEKLRNKLQSWKNKIIIYGDASNQRRTETANINDTNWTIVKKYFPDAEYRVPSVNPNIKERVEYVNAKLNSFDNRIGLYVNSKNCEKMIMDLEQVNWNKTGTGKDKSNPELNHNSDNLDYLVNIEFPLVESAFSETEQYADSYAQYQRSTERLLS